MRFVSLSKGEISSTALLAWALVGLDAPALAQASELAVKAAFLPKFVRYVDWPGEVGPGTSINLCIIGKDPFGRLLDEAVAGQRVEQNSIAVRRINSPALARGCHIAFVGGASASKSLGALSTLPILTVTDARDGAQRGMIHFAVFKGRVGFHVDEAMAARSNLAVSSRLLAVALSVKQRRS